MNTKVRVGVIGLGMMGHTHLDVYARRDDVEVVAVADRDEARLRGASRPRGNIRGQAEGGFDLGRARRYREGAELIAQADVDLIDICVPTPGHLALGEAALASGRHVLIEKPLARTHAEALQLTAAGDGAAGLAMPAMCMRFWPGWVWLKQAIDRGDYGGVLAATFRRVASHPGGPFYTSGPASGGAILDLHIHDTDFVAWCFGTPDAVSSRGYAHVTSAIDHVVTSYHYDRPDAPLIVAEGGWAMAGGFPFSMQFTVNFRHATAVFDSSAAARLMLYRDGRREPVELPAGMGYSHEIAYLIDCIHRGVPPATVTLANAAESIRIVEAEALSIARRQPVAL